jgi:phage terminase small subunit
VTIEEKSVPTAQRAQSLAEKIGASFKNHPLRQAYEDEVRALETKALELGASGKSKEAIARELHELRRQLGVKYKDATPEPFR